jgi:hypothetical protein
MMKKPYLIVIGLAVVLAVAYWCLEASDAAQGLRQTLITPVICAAFLLRKIFHVHLGEPGSFMQSLDTDAGGHGPMLLRTVVFALFALAVCTPWCVWLRTRNRKHLVLAVTILTTYIMSSFGFMVFLGLAMRGLGK